MSEHFLPYGRPCIDENDIATVAAVLRSGWLTTGPQVAAFEAALKKAVGAEYAVACSSGTAALHLAAMALGVGPGDYVVVPALTFLASANAPRFTGAEIVFADVDPDTALLTPETLEAAFQRAAGPVRAVIAVHMNGQCCDMRALAVVAQRHGAVIVEDGSHALGSNYITDNTRYPIGACRYSAMTCFSFHPVKLIAMGEGGAVTTNDQKLEERLRLLRNHGIMREAVSFSIRNQAFDAEGAANPWYYEMPELGYNYRVSDINCALGSSQLVKIKRLIEKRRALVAAYDVRFADFPDAIRTVRREPYCDPSWHLYVLLVDWDRLTKSRAAAMRALARKGIGTQVHYLPLHRQPYYRGRYGDIALPGSDDYYRRALSIPLYPGLRDVDLERVVEALASVLGVTAYDK
jgi:UDP-4-amino-4,6-dideoxy-N-acetyl-beta-L-altrosamine transaminase